MEVRQGKGAGFCVWFLRSCSRADGCFDSCGQCAIRGEVVSANHHVQLNLPSGEGCREIEFRSIQNGA